MTNSPFDQQDAGQVSSGTKEPKTFWVVTCSAACLAILAGGLAWRFGNSASVPSGPPDLNQLIQMGNVADAQKLIERGDGSKPCSEYSDLNESPLGAAARKRELPIVEALLKAGADPNCCGSDGFSPLRKAIQGSRAFPIDTTLKVLDVLIKGKADVNDPARDPSRLTPLHVAVYEADPRVVERLLAAGAKVNAQNANGTTPIAWLAGRTTGDWRGIEKMLLEHGADPDIKDSHGNRARDAAIEIATARRKPGQEQHVQEFIAIIKKYRQPPSKAKTP
jgi:ankyrin repeat protein